MNDYEPENVLQPSATERSLLRNTVVVGLCTLASRILGFARELLMAYLFGTTLWQSAFRVAFTVPNTFRRVFGEGALASAFIPVFTETMEKEGKTAAWSLAGKTLNLLMLTLALIVIIGMIVMRVGKNATLPGSQAHVVWSLLGIMFPYLFFICVAALCMAILNSQRRFLLPSLTAPLLNVVWILAMLAIIFWGRPDSGWRIRVIAATILVAGMLQAAFQFPALWKGGFRGSRALGIHDRRIRRVLILMGPAAIGMGVSQINIGIDRLLALFAGDWAPAALSFAERLVYLPLGLFATAMGTVLLPTLSRSAARREHAAMAKTVETSLVHLMMIMAPAAFGLLLLADPMVTLAYQRGRFDAQSTLLTARALRFYAPGLVTFSLYKVFVPAFYALKDTRTPVKIGLTAVGINLGLNLLFVFTWPEFYRHAGLAMATVLAAACNGTMLAVSLRRRTECFRAGNIASAFLRIFLCAVLMGAMVWLARNGAYFLATHLGFGPTGQAGAALFAGLAAGLAGYAIPLRWSMPTEWNTIVKAWRNRSHRNDK